MTRISPHDGEQFGVPGCTCRPFTGQNGMPRYLDQPGDTADLISGWETGTDCPHHSKTDAMAPGLRGLLERVGIDTTGKDIRVSNRVVDAWPHSCTYRAIRCNLARTRQEHVPHDWEPQPGMTPLHCSGWNPEEGVL
jgi:hypothetical protein